MSALFRAGYNFTSLSAQTLLHATGQSGWKASNEPLRSLLTQYGNANTAPLSAARSAAEYLAGVWRHRETRSKAKVARAITVRTLTQLRKHPRGLVMIAYVKQGVHVLLSSERQPAKQFRRTVERFLRGY